MSVDKAGKVILVVGATGQQGGAARRHLRANGWAVRALTRQADGAAARALAASGVEIAQGDLDDRPALDRALDGVYGVFSVQTWQGTEPGIAIQTRQGMALADAAGTAGVAHLVHSSVDGAERSSGIPHFENQYPVEQHIRALGLPATILRPVFFMENFNMFFLQSIRHGAISMELRPDKPLQMIAVDDIGGIAALAFEEPERFVGRTLAIAGDELTMPQAAQVLTEHLGMPIQYVDNPSMWSGDEFLSREFRAMFDWYNAHGYHADIAAVRALYPPLKTLKAWLRQTGWGVAAPEDSVAGVTQRENQP